MKKLSFLLTLLLAFTAIWSDEVTLNDGRSFYGTITGKQGDYLYLSTNSQNYQIEKSSIKSVFRNGSLVTKLIFGKKDFMDDDQGNYTLIEKTDTLDLNQPQSKPSIIDKDLLNLSDREFEIYKLEQQQKQLDEIVRANKSIGSALWVSVGITVTSIIIIGIALNE